MLPLSFHFLAFVATILSREEVIALCTLCDVTFSVAPRSRSFFAMTTSQKYEW